MEQIVNTHGGKRKGAGPPFKYGEDTCNITLRVPKSKKEEIKRLIYKHLEQYKSKRTDDYGC
jgi:hypothetical protein